MTERTTERKVAEAADAALALANRSDATRNAALEAVADAIEDDAGAILEANAADVEEAEALLEAGEYTRALVDRLRLTPTKLEDIAAMVRSVADQRDPLGRTLEARRLDDGLELYKVSVPIGVIGTVFESRPDALVQIASLALKSGNAVILKGGSEAARSNRALFESIRRAAEGFSLEEEAGGGAGDAGDAAVDGAIPTGWAQLVEAREDVQTMLGMDDAIDLLMPRGSYEFVKHIKDNTSIPVLGHTEGICHVFVDAAADLAMAEEVAYDAKVQYPAVCNAMETLLVHEDVLEAFLPGLVERYRAADVELRGDEAVRAVVDVAPATREDWSTEYGDLELSIKVVDSLSAAIDHVNTFGSKHTDSIVTEDADRAARFMREVDAASVFHNASTRFSDGYRYGLGAEVGIATGKIHARGPVGLEGLTSYKWHLEGSGQVVATYSGADAKPFRHEDFEGTWRPGRLSDG